MMDVIGNVLSVIIGIGYTLGLIVVSPLILPILAIIALYEKDLGVIHDLYVEVPADYLTTRVAKW